MADPQVPVPQSPTDPAGAAALAKYLQGLFAPAQTGASALLEQVTRPGGIYDPKSDLERVGQLSQLANTLPTQADIEAQQAGQSAQGADFLLQQLAGVPVPQEQMLQQPNLPQLQLPPMPQTAQPHVNPLASLLAIGAGFARPTAAGQFNAATLEGALKGAADENQRRQERDRADIARRAMIYDASMAAAKEQQRVQEANRDAAYHNTVANTDRQMLLAKARTEQFQAHGAADSLKAFAEKYDPALKARDQVKALLDEIDTKGKASTERVKSISELLSAVNRETTVGAGPGLAKNVFDEIMKGVQQTAKQRADEKSQREAEEARMAQIQAEIAGRAAVSDNVQHHEDMRAAADRSLRKDLQRSGQVFDLQRDVINKALDPKTLPPREKAYTEDLGRLQDTLKLQEKSISALKTKYAGLNPGDEAAKKLKLQIADMQRQIDATRNTMAGEQRELERENKARRDAISGKPGVFNPVTGRVE